MTSINLRDLEAFALVVERRSFRAAAREMGLSPSALSYIVTTLEASAGLQLLHRTTRSVSPTDAGRDLLGGIHPALEMINDAFRSLQDHREVPAGRIRINSSESAAERLVPDILAFMRLYPEISIDLVTEDRLIDISAEGFDAGVRLHESVPQDMVALRLWRRSALVLVASPEYLKTAGTPASPADLPKHACIISTYAGKRPLDWELSRAGRSQRPKLSSRLHVGTIELARLCALGSAGIAYVDHWSVREDLGSGRLVQILEGWTQDFDGSCLYYPRHRQQSTAFKAFTQFIRERYLSDEVTMV